MNELFTILTFTVPGFLAYFWINLFGFTPSTKRDNSEVVIFSALLWIPIVILIVIIYELFAFITHFDFLYPDKNVPLLRRDWEYIISIDDLKNKLKLIWFFLYYLGSSIIISYIGTKIFTSNFYKYFRKKVNKVRKKNGIAPLSEQSTVWNQMFLTKEGQLVEYKKIGEGNSYVGMLINVPRAHEQEKGIVLEAVDHWTKIMEYYDVQLDQTYVDATNGYVINVFNLEKALEAQRLFNQRFPNGVT